MGHAAEEYIVRNGNRLEGFGTKGRIDRFQTAQPRAAVPT
jgi:hypothetical protein